MIAADYPFLDVLWTMFIFFAWVIWFWLLITIFADIFRRHDIGGGTKTLWCIFVIITPFIGVFVYLISQSKGMNERNLQNVKQQRQQTDEYIRSVAADRSCRTDRAGEVAARQRRDQPAGVRRAEAEGARG